MKSGWSALSSLGQRLIGLIGVTLAYWALCVGCDRV
jgi:hypothetical protein